MWIKKIVWTTISIIPFSYVYPIIACEISSLTIKPMNNQSNYDVFNTSSYAAINSYRISANILGEDCQFNAILKMDDDSRTLKGTNNETLAFEWYEQFGTSIANQWLVSLTESQPSATVQMRFPSNQWLTSGSYQGVLNVALANLPEDSLIEVSPSTLPVTVNVPPVARIHYYGLQQQDYDLDLGELFSNKVISSSPNLWIQSNSPYSVVLASAHQGNLRHESNDSKWDIPYQMTLDNDIVDLKELEAYISSQRVTSGRSIPISFIIGDIHQKPSGQYEDTLEISIEPQLSQQPNP